MITMYWSQSDWRSIIFKEFSLKNLSVVEWRVSGCNQSWVMMMNLL